MELNAPEGGSWSLGGITYVGEHPGYGDDNPYSTYQFTIDLLSTPFQPWKIIQVQKEAISTGIEAATGIDTGIDTGDIKDTIGMGVLGLALIAVIAIAWKS